MELLESIVTTINSWIWQAGIPVKGERIPFVVIALLGTGVFLTFRLGFIQFRKLGHGIAVTSGKYDDPDEPGDVPHFQALTTALSATVGIGNIAGVAIAIHWGGPGALFWMWITALLGMAVKYAEVTLAQYYRRTETGGGEIVGTVSGGPMYYIEKGLGPAWKPLAVFFALMLGFTAFFTGNAVQANTVADTMHAEFGLPAWLTGLITATLVGAVVLGGIRRIGKVTAILAPVMAIIYMIGALYIILTNIGQVFPVIGLILSEAFNPTAGAAGGGIGALLVTMMWGVRRGLFSNEAGQGSAPIAHAAAKTDEPVSEGVVALLEPFIDTLVICTMTGFVVIMTGVWDDRVPTTLNLSSGNISYVVEEPSGRIVRTKQPDNGFEVHDGYPVATAQSPRMAWHDAAVERFYINPEQTVAFSGTVRTGTNAQATATDGTTYTVLYGNAAVNGAPLTMLGFQRGLPGEWGRFIVLVSVLLFAVSTAISWSYYGDRCANYLFGQGAILPYKIVFVGMHFFGAMVSLNVIWDMGDIALGIVIIPNLLALILLSDKVKELTDSYFQRKPWIENAMAHKRAIEKEKTGRT